jgi:hypothetical protein
MKIFEKIFVILIFVIGIIYVGRDLWGIKFSHYPGDKYDTRFNNVILEHNYRFFRGIEKSYLSAKFFYPAKKSIAGSDHHLFPSLIYSFLRLCGLDMFYSFSLWVLILFLLNYFSSFYILNKSGIDFFLSGIGAFLFSFSLPIMAQTMHIQTLYIFPIPFIFYFLQKFFETNEYKYFLKFFIFFLILYYTSPYFSCLILIPLFFFTITSIIINKEKFLKYIYKDIFLKLITIIVFFILILPFYLVYTKTGDFWSKGHIIKNLPSFIAYMVPFHGSFLYKNFSLYFWKLQTDPWHKEYSFGLITSSILFFYIFKGIKFRDLFPYIITIFLTILIFTKIGNFSLYSFILEIKIFRKAQAVWRYYHILLFPIIFSSLKSIQRYTLNFKLRNFIYIFLLISVLIENFPLTNSMKNTPILEIKNAHKDLEEVVKLKRKKEHKCFVVILPDSLKGKNIKVDLVSTMIVYQNLNFPTINGYTTFSPKGYNMWDEPTWQDVVSWLKYNGWEDEKIESKVLKIYFDGEKYY